MKKNASQTKLLSVTLIAACLNLNKASITDLMHFLPAIGVKRAKNIIEYRKRHHGFSSIYELEAVRGIGPHYVQKNLTAIETNCFKP